MNTTQAKCAAGIALALLVGASGATAARLRPHEQSARGGASITLDQLATGLDRPVYLTHAGDGSGRLFIVEKPGRILIYQNGQVLATPFLDIRTRVEDGGNEQGLLSVAFHPDFATNRRFFVYYTSDDDGGSVKIAEYHASAANPNLADTSEREILHIQHPSFQNHNGGLLKFGPDGYLYAGIGDGGGAGDPGPPPGNGQNTNVLLGKILRIDVDSSSAEDYGIPPGNPFASGAGGRPEIYAFGFRNPWRYSFDRETGDLWVGDVGQNTFEEVDVVTVGGNYGWNRMEGFHCFSPSTGCQTPDLLLPIFEYSHNGSNGVSSGVCSITGGYVYRGSQIPSLVGTYLFADYCGGTGTLYGIHNGDTTATSFPTGVSGEPVTSFGEDQSGELYVVTDSVFGGHGRVYKVVRAGGGCDLGCPGDVSAVDSDGNGSETVTFDPPTSAGDCGTVTCDPPSGTAFAVGTTTVTCTSAMGDGSCSFSVAVAPAGGLSVTGVDPSSAPRKTTLTVTVTGSGFASGATVSFGKKIKVTSTTVVSATEIQATIKVKKAKRGPRAVTVTNPGGASATCGDCFTVE
jgi:glucose/arabinose dehydrogenase